jgi:glycine dehydrogenase subunit 1
VRYLPKSPADREQMLREIGCGSIDDLFAPIPAEYRLKRDLKSCGRWRIGDPRLLPPDVAPPDTRFSRRGAYSHYRQ